MSKVSVSTLIHQLWMSKVSISNQFSLLLTSKVQFPQAEGARPFDDSTCSLSRIPLFLSSDQILKVKKRGHHWNQQHTIWSKQKPARHCPKPPMPTPYRSELEAFVLSRTFRCLLSSMVCTEKLWLFYLKNQILIAKVTIILSFCTLQTEKMHNLITFYVILAF